MVEPKTKATGSMVRVPPARSTRGIEKGNASALDRAREELLDSPAEAMVSWSNTVSRLFERRIRASSDCTCRNPLHAARGDRLGGVFGAPLRTAVPPLRRRDQPRSPPKTLEITITVASMAVVLPLRLGGARTPLTRPGAAGSRGRAGGRIPRGKSGYRKDPNFLLAVGRSG